MVTKMKLFHSLGIISFFLFAIINGGLCEEDPGVASAVRTSESTVTSTLPTVNLSSAPGWWVGPAQPNLTAEVEESQNEKLDEGNLTTNGDWMVPPLIIFRYPLLDGLPEILVGTFSQKNGTHEGGNDKIDSDFNITGFPVSTGEEIEEVKFDIPNGTELWIEDFFLVSDENVTENSENKVGNFGTTVQVNGKEEEQPEVISPAEILLNTTDSSMTENVLQESVAPSPFPVQGAENSLLE